VAYIRPRLFHTRWENPVSESLVALLNCSSAENMNMSRALHKGTMAHSPGGLTFVFYGKQRNCSAVSLLLLSVCNESLKSLPASGSCCCCCCCNNNINNKSGCFCLFFIDIFRFFC